LAAQKASSLFLLANKAILLVVAKNTSIADRGRVLVAEAHDLAGVVVTDATFAAPIRSQDFSQARRV